ncbi:MAG: DNA repair protein RadC [Kofleriaceae bacterium]
MRVANPCPPELDEPGAVTVERPTERLRRRGPRTIGDDELLALVLGTSTRRRPTIDVARELVRSAGGVATLSHSTSRELSHVPGVGAARAARVVAAFELGRRAIEVLERRDPVGRPEDIYRLVAPRVAGLAQEVFLVIGIDIRNGLLDIAEIARGSVASVEVHPREVFRPLIRMAAAGGVLAHNHPSGDPTPSAEDVALTRRLRAAGELLGIPIIDHVVIGNRSFRSVAEYMGAEL